MSYRVTAHHDTRVTWTGITHLEHVDGKSSQVTTSISLYLHVMYLLFVSSPFDVNIDTHYLITTKRTSLTQRVSAQISTHVGFRYVCT